MTTQITEVRAAESPMPTLRDSLMQALAVGESVVAQLADDPTDVKFSFDHVSSYTVELYFHHEPERVVRFAAVFDTEVSVEEDFGPRCGSYTSARCTVDGVPVLAWSLTALDEVTDEVAA